MTLMRLDLALINVEFWEGEMSEIKIRWKSWSNWKGIVMELESGKCLVKILRSLKVRRFVSLSTNLIQGSV